MLRKTRIAISVLLFALITFYFIDFAGLLPNEFHVLAHLQLVAALLSLSAGILLFLVVIALLFGRIYCSTICPMGIYQDVVTWISKKSSSKRKRFTYSPAKTVLRWGVLGVTVAAFFGGFTVLLALLDPYSAYGRMINGVIKPIYMGANNLLESILSSYGNYTLYKVDASIWSVSSFAIGLATLIVIGYLAWRYGRTWCNTMCPVGTVLGFISRVSFFKVRIDTGKCNHCGLCASRCKASCINSKEQVIDYSRCVACFNCLDVCKEKALLYSPKLFEKQQPKQEDASKRRFLLSGLTAAIAAPKAMAETAQAIASSGHGRKEYKVKHPITPPGAISQQQFQSQCTSCHLCVSKCPSHVLKPSFMEYGLGGMMQPMVNFERGFCNFDCTVCGNVCPTGAIQPLTKPQKHLTQMGYVVFIEQNCIVYTDGTSCGACSEHCPTQAIAMVEYKNGLTIPHVNVDICVGCGGCEYICPARPFRAVHIEGNPIQKQAKPFEESKQEAVEIDGFGF